MSNSYQDFMSNIGLPAADTELLELFHESSKVNYSTALKRDVRIGAYLYDPRCVLEASRNRKIFQTSPKVSLPKARKLTMALDDAFQQRTSCRTFVQPPLTAEDLATVLNSLRVTRTGFSAEFDEVPMAMRTYPSPGGLYPVEVYVLALNSDDIERGVYHFNFETHELARINSLPQPDELAMMLGDHDKLHTYSASFAVVLSSVLPRSTVKYENLGYRFSLIESGIMGQHLALAATAENIGSLFWGAYYDDKIHDLLQVDGVEEIVTNFIWLGNKE
ncbi:SagB/ThcOx family dehydrogenase [Thalassotalea fusca]